MKHEGLYNRETKEIIPIFNTIDEPTEYEIRLFKIVERIRNDKRLFKLVEILINNIPQ